MKKIFLFLLILSLAGCGVFTSPSIVIKPDKTITITGYDSIVQKGEAVSFNRKPILSWDFLSDAAKMFDEVVRTGGQAANPKPIEPALDLNYIKPIEPVNPEPLPPLPPSPVEPVPVAKEIVVLDLEKLPGEMCQERGWCHPNPNAAYYVMVCKIGSGWEWPQHETDSISAVWWNQQTEMGAWFDARIVRAANEIKAGATATIIANDAHDRCGERVGPVVWERLKTTWCAYGTHSDGNTVSSVSYNEAPKIRRNNRCCLPKRV